MKEINYPDFRLDGRLMMVTGAGGGIGSVIARASAHAGVKVALAGRNIKRMNEVAASIQKEGGKVEVFSLDLLDCEKIQETVKEIEEKMGVIDILVNCAGTNVYRLAIDVSEAEYDKIMDVNMKGTFFVTQAVARYMIERKRGKIVNITSVMGLVGGDYRSVYCASKGGMIQYTKALAIELAPYNINVNAVAPNFTRTEINKKMLDDPKRIERILSEVPLRRLGRPEDTAGAVIYLSSSASDFITGHVLVVDGGKLAL